MAFFIYQAILDNTGGKIHPPPGAVHTRVAEIPQLFGNAAVIGLGNASRNAGHGVGVPAQRNRQAEGAFVIPALQKGGNGGRDATAGAAVKPIAWAKLRQRDGKVKATSLFHKPADFFLTVPMPGQKHRTRYRLRATDGLFMTMGKITACCYFL